ncbi:hypothetical protein C1H46_035755 [Malus baccata]|uniref:Uncharacterized protein n=1 Tax=Malus baccata TaxID=106549 RepID=A0A540KWU2_MALBA|nr:hypothetical protein C1H46_035755 [Malus baccata]
MASQIINWPLDRPDHDDDLCPMPARSLISSAISLLAFHAPSMVSLALSPTVSAILVAFTGPSLLQGHSSWLDLHASLHIPSPSPLPRKASPMFH